MFNTHGNKTSNGQTIVAGLRVRDYNYNEGVVVHDSTDIVCSIVGDACQKDHWFDVQTDNNGMSLMNGERLVAI